MDSDDEVDITPKQQPEDEGAQLPALFWDSMPENAEEHPDYIALKALEEESTPEERAENFKVSINSALLKATLQAAGLHVLCCLPALEQQYSSASAAQPQHRSNGSAGNAGLDCIHCIVQGH
jgi:hypothetical protein